MADIFRRQLDCKTGKGGIHCTCCNWTIGNSSKARKRAKTKLNKMIRQILKRNFDLD